MRLGRRLVAALSIAQRVARTAQERACEADPPAVADRDELAPAVLEPPAHPLEVAGVERAPAETEAGQRGVAAVAGALGQLEALDQQPLGAIGILEEHEQARGGERLGADVRGDLSVERERAL